jgi:hypothetical protein
MITTIRPNKMPTLWWLFPWAYARTLHMSANAVKAYADRQDQCLEILRGVIEIKDAEIRTLKLRIADQNDAIIRGTAITPDARPYHAASERLQDEANARGNDLTSHE